LKMKNDGPKTNCQKAAQNLNTHKLVPPQSHVQTINKPTLTKTSPMKRTLPVNIPKQTEWRNHLAVFKITVWQDLWPSPEDGNRSPSGRLTSLPSTTRRKSLNEHTPHRFCEEWIVV
jgi:hypothetical protein